MMRTCWTAGVVSLFLVVGLLGAGCSSDSKPEIKLVSIQVEPQTAKITVGETRQFNAVGYFADNSTRDITAEVVWHSSNEAVATINAAGVATGVAEGGTAEITATAGPLTSNPPAVLQVVSSANRLTEIAVEPSTAQIQLGASFQFSASGTYLDGSTRDITEEVVWESTNPTIVSVSNTPGSRGVAVGLAAGAADITARSDDILSGPASASVTEVALESISVSPVDPTLPLGTTQQFRATGRYSDDSTADLTHVVTWMSSNKVVAGFSGEPGEEGLCAAHAEGTTSITAISGTTSSEPVTLTVTAATLQRLDIEPVSTTVPVGTTVQFSATGTFSDGQVLDLTGSATWHTADETVVAPGAAAGQMQAAAEGSAEVWADYNGIESPHATVTVSSASLESIEISPVNPTLPVGQQLSFTAFGHYSDQSVVDITADVTWDSSDKAVATVSNAGASKGMATGLAEGTTTVTASRNGTSGEATLRVRDIEIETIVVTPNGATLPEGERLQYTATATFNDGSEAEATSVVTWYVGSTLVAEIGNGADDKGLATARGVGSTTVWCTSTNGVSSSPVQLTVTSATLSSIEVTAPDASLVVGATTQFSATGHYTDGSELPLTTEAAWASSNEAAATVSNSAGTRGLATALAEGVTFVTASKDGIDSNSFRLEVVSPSLESIALTPADATIAAGETVTYTAMGTYSDGQDRDVTGLAYWEADPAGVASVSNAPGTRGLATGLAEGTTGITASYQGVTSPAASLAVTAPVNQQPVADITGDAAAAVGEDAAFSGSSSYDPDGSIVNYTFNFGDGTGDHDNGTDPEIVHQFASANTYTVVLTVTDDLGATGSDTMQIVVSPEPNEAPHAILVCPSQGQVDQSLEFDASNSYDNDGTVANYTFNFGDGSGDQDNGLSPTIFHSYSNENTYTVTLIVTDDDGAQDSTTCQVPIGATTLPEVRIIRPQGTEEVTQGEALNVLVDANGQGGFSITKVELLADGVLQGEDTTAPYEYDYTVPAGAATGSTITLQARAYDNNTPPGEGLSQPVFLDVCNHHPVADFTATISDALEVTVDASSCSDAETPLADLEVRWDWQSDGTWDTSWDTTKVLSHTYPSDGTYTITMEVRDGVGQTDWTDRTVDLASQQTVGGEITTTTWYGTIIVTGSVTVPAGEVLTINPNTQILVMYLDQNGDGTGDFGIYIDGEIHVDGTEEDPVLFSMYGSDHKEPGAWQGIVVSGATPSSFDYAVVEYAEVGLEIQNDSTVNNSTFRFNRQAGLYLNGAHGAALTSVTCHDNEEEGLVLHNSDNVVMNGINALANGSNGVRLDGSDGGSLTTCLVSDNGADGVIMLDSSLDILDCTVTTNHGYGLLYQGNSNGSMSESVVTYNDDVGIRAESAGGHPQPSINLNNIYGNSVVAGTTEVLVDPSSVLTHNGPYSSGWSESGTWTTPNGRWIARAYFEFSENYSSTGYLLTGGGTTITSQSNDWVGWVDVRSHRTDSLKVALNQYYDSNYNNDNQVTVTQLGYPEASASGLEMSVSVTSGTVDARYNYWGTFPNILDHIFYNDPAAVDIQGFVGQAFDATWDTGPYVAGSISSQTWSGIIYVTGDTYVPSGETLTIDAGTNVLFVPTDQDFDGVGDYSLVADGVLDVNGTSADHVVFTAHGSSPTTSSFDKVYTAGTSTIDYADFTYGHIGLELQDASTVSYCTFEDNNLYGLYLNNADSCVLDHLTVQNNRDLGVRVSNATGVTVTYLDVLSNTGSGMLASSSGGTLTDCTFQDNGDTGLVLEDTSFDLDHCAFLYNGGAGINYLGNCQGGATRTNVKYNDLPGVIAESTGSHPLPDISYSNIYGNSVVASMELVTADPSATLTHNGPYSSGWSESASWSTPGGKNVYRANFAFSENYSSTGYLLTGGGTTITSQSNDWSGWVDVTPHATDSLKVALNQYYDSNYNNDNQVTVTSVEYLGQVSPPDTIEMTTATVSGQIAANHNYWGQQTNVADRISMSRSDAVDFTSWELGEVSGCGPR